MADALDLGSCAARRVGSSPTFRTKKKRGPKGPLFCFKRSGSMGTHAGLVEVFYDVFHSTTGVGDAGTAAEILWRR